MQDGTNTVISVQNVSKFFRLRIEKSFKESFVSLFRKDKNQSFTALKNINLQIRQGETLGLTGHNGSGKSTLLKIIGGILDPSQGRVLKAGRLAALLELGAGFHPDLTGRENIYLNAAVLGMTRSETQAVIDEIIDFSGVPTEFIESQVKFYSSGMYVR